MDYTEYARLFKALSDPKRLKIVHMLAGGELCACKILEEFHITQPTLSHDMKLLTDTGLVIPRREDVGTPGEGFGENGAGYFRLTSFGDRENTIEAVERIKKVLTNLSK